MGICENPTEYIEINNYCYYCYYYLSHSMRILIFFMNKNSFCLKVETKVKRRKQQHGRRDILYLYYLSLYIFVRFFILVVRSSPAVLLCGLIPLIVQFCSFRIWHKYTNKRYERHREFDMPIVRSYFWRIRNVK